MRGPSWNGLPPCTGTPSRTASATASPALRHYFVNRAGITADPEAKVFADLITPGAQAVLMNADDALRAGIISTKTRDLLAILAKFRCDHALLLGNGEWGDGSSGFLGLVSDCEKESDGPCTAGRLVELAVEREIIPRHEMEIAAKAAEEERIGYVPNSLIAPLQPLALGGRPAFHRIRRA